MCHSTEAQRKELCEYVKAFHSGRRIYRYCSKTHMYVCMKLSLWQQLHVCWHVLLFSRVESVANDQVDGDTNVEFLWNRICHPALVVVSSESSHMSFLPVCVRPSLLCGTILAFWPWVHEWRNAFLCVYVNNVHKQCLPVASAGEDGRGEIQRKQNL